MKISNKNLVKSLFALTATATVALASGCGDEASKCAGHGDCERLEGGETRIEIVRLPDGTIIERATTFSIDSMVRDAHPLPAEGQCWSLRADQVWPIGQDPERTYGDLGETVEISGGGTMTLMKQPAGKDFFSRDHDLFYTAVSADQSLDILSENALYSINFKGSSYEDVVYVPPNWTMVSPVHGPVDFDSSEDFEFTYTSGDYTNFPESTTFDPFFTVAFVEAGVGPHSLCVGLVSEGKITVPKAFLDTIPETGIMIIGQTIHNVVNIDEREIDFVGQNCKGMPYSVNGAVVPM